ncbi:hypothetical protein [Polyangium sp. 6x1]|uniref:hypothetical protein n=1 Tax=Polyangium sp. 6x1 TaxID=3042689 RepID=UPI0024828B26|nr:hypothetical protein [Polyangium sp. 6x1]MDI1447313.1 hypothetical protein [Polyangium sp. 6x1]
MGRTLRIVMLAALAALPLLAAPPAEAQRRTQNPVFRNLGIDITNKGHLDIDFREYGLARRGNVEVQLRAEVRAVYRCATRNGVITGGQADRKILRQYVAEKVTLRADREGRVVGSMNLEAPQAAAFCARDRYPVLVRVTFDDVTLRDNTNGVAVRLEGRYSERIGNRYNPFTVFDRRDDDGRHGDRFRIQ